MNTRKKESSSSVRPEAELESRLARALETAFPNIPRDHLAEQRRFTVRLGHATHEFDSASEWAKSGRADIIIGYAERSLALIEIKREDLKLTPDDYQQAQSYANQLTPRPPLVIVTNGAQTCIYDSSTGQPWSSEEDATSAVQRLLANAAKIAAADMRWAIEALMGRETGVWVPVIRSATSVLLKEMTDEPGESSRPFAQSLLFSRTATVKAIELLINGIKVVIIEGAPLTGKSSLLRELALCTNESAELAVLMLRGTGPGLFQSLSNLFATELEWSTSPSDVRHWLRRMSKGSAGPCLVLAIDDVEPDTPMAMDLEELANEHNGKRLSVIITMHQANRLTRAPNGRGTTALGTHARIIEIGPLGLTEFQNAHDVLAALRIRFEQGAKFSQDYRAPWVLREIYDRTVCHPIYKTESYDRIIPASLDLELVVAAQRILAGNDALQRGYRLLARCALFDEGEASVEFKFATARGFLVRQDALSDEARYALVNLNASGAVRLFRHIGGEDVVAPTVPAAFLVELADATGVELGRRAINDPYDAGVWLGNRLSAVYLGDVVGAQAIRCMAEKVGGFSPKIIFGLLSIEPKEEHIESGVIALDMQDGELTHFRKKGDQLWLSDQHGRLIGESIDIGEDQPKTYIKLTSWMILGIFAGLPSALSTDDCQRMDAYVLLTIGQCTFPLLRVTPDGQGYLDQDLGEIGQVLSLECGLAESVTQSMAKMLCQPWQGANEWISKCIETGSIPLMHRLLIALQAVRLREIPTLSEWAEDVSRNQVLPAVRAAFDAANE